MQKKGDNYVPRVFGILFCNFLVFVVANYSIKTNMSRKLILKRGRKQNATTKDNFC